MQTSSSRIWRACRENHSSTSASLYGRPPCTWRMTSGSYVSAAKAARSDGSSHGRISRRSVSRLNMGFLNDLKDAEEIRAEDLLDLVLVHSAIEEPRGDGGEGGGGLQAARQRRHAVEVGADADVIDAGDVDGVHDVIDGVVELRGRTAERVEPDQVLVPVGRVVRQL